jgi:hypothetical protein
MAKEGINEMRALNTTDRSIEGSRDGYANGTRPVEGGHSKAIDPTYEHWCRPEPKQEFPYKSADLERAREKQGGMQDDTDLKRAENGGVMGSQVGVKVPKDSPHFQDTSWGEYESLRQWDRPQAGTYRGEEKEPFDKN